MEYVNFLKVASCMVCMKNNFLRALCKALNHVLSKLSGFFRQQVMLAPET